MDQEPPAKRNTFVIVAALLFNFIWIALLFLSCQADNDPNPTPTPTPEARIKNHTNEIFAGTFGLETGNQCDTQTRGRGAPVPGADEMHLKFDPVCRDYSAPLYKPPSTCSITPLI